jgi:hypothetical protein
MNGSPTDLGRYESSLECGFRGFDGHESDSLPCLAGWQGLAPWPAFVVS